MGIIGHFKIGVVAAEEASTGHSFVQVSFADDLFFKRRVCCQKCAEGTAKVLKQFFDGCSIIGIEDAITPENTSSTKKEMH